MFDNVEDFVEKLAMQNFHGALTLNWFIILRNKFKKKAFIDSQEELVDEAHGAVAPGLGGLADEECSMVLGSENVGAGLDV